MPTGGTDVKVRCLSQVSCLLMYNLNVLKQLNFTFVILVFLKYSLIIFPVFRSPCEPEVKATHRPPCLPLQMHFCGHLT